MFKSPKGYPGSLATACQRQVIRTSSYKPLTQHALIILSDAFKKAFFTLGKGELLLSQKKTFGIGIQGIRQVDLVFHKSYAFIEDSYRVVYPYSDINEKCAPGAHFQV